MEFRILGPLEVRDGQRMVEVGAAKQRALLGVLLLHANELVSTSQLVEELWGERPPATAEKLVQGYVHALRKRLAADVIVTQGPGYKLHVAANSLDLLEFERLIAEAREAPLPEAVELRRRALSLWRGRPLADVVIDGSARFALAQSRRAPPEHAARADRRRARARPPCGHRRRARVARRGAPVPGAGARAPRARPLPLGTAGGRARGLPGGSPDGSPTSSGSSRARSCATSRRRSCGRTRPSHGASLTTASSGRRCRRSKLPATRRRAALEGPAASSWQPPSSWCSPAQRSRPRSLRDEPAAVAVPPNSVAVIDPEREPRRRRGSGRHPARPGRRGHRPGLGRQRRGPVADANRAPNGTRPEVRPAARDADGARGRLRRRLGRARPTRPTLQGRSDLRARDGHDRRDEDRVRDVDGQRRGRLRRRLGRVRRFDACTRRPEGVPPHGRDLRGRPSSRHRRGRRVRLGRERWRADGERFNPATFEEGPVAPPISVGNRPTGIAYGEGAVWVANGGDDTVMPHRPERALGQVDSGRRRARSRRGRRRRGVGRERRRRDRLAHRSGDLQGRDDRRRRRAGRDRRRGRTCLGFGTRAVAARGRYGFRQAAVRSSAGRKTMQPTRFETSVGSSKNSIGTSGAALRASSTSSAPYLS